MEDHLSLVVGQTKISGWKSVQVSRGIERLPSDFEVELTERYPGDIDAVVVKPGDACQVFLGSDLVITGYIDRFQLGISPRAHTLRISGRGKCQDLVDCSAEWPNGQVANATALDIARRLGKVYGINATGMPGKLIPQFNVMWGETAWDIIERVCRYSGLLAFDQPDGSLLLAQAGTTEAASGFREGDNVETADASFAMDQRFSMIVTRLLSMALLADVGRGQDILATARDPGVPRHRLKYLVVESGDDGDFTVSRQRGLWEVARRMGRARQVTITTDSWRDKAGRLWTPNTLVPLELPSLKISGEKWLVANVTSSRNESGTRASLTLMPRAAFLPQPVVLEHQFRDVQAALRETPR